MLTSFNPHKPAVRFGDFNMIAKDGFIAATKPSFEKNNIEAKVADGPYFHRHGDNHIDEYLVPIHTKNNLAALENIITNPEIRKTVVGLHGNLQVVAKDGFIAQAKPSFEKNKIEAAIPDGPYFHRHGANNVAEYLVPIQTKNNLAALENIMTNPEVRKTVVDFQA